MNFRRLTVGGSQAQLLQGRVGTQDSHWGRNESWHNWTRHCCSTPHVFCCTTHDLQGMSGCYAFLEKVLQPQVFCVSWVAESSGWQALRAPVKGLPPRQSAPG